ELDRGQLVQHLRLVRTCERVGYRVVAGGDVLDTGVGAQDLLAAGQHLISALSRAAGERRGRMRLHGTQPATPRWSAATPRRLGVSRPVVRATIPSGSRPAQARRLDR